MTLFKRAALALALIAAPTFSSASTFLPGDYDALNYDGVRSIWTPRNSNGQPSGDALVSGNGATTLWSFTNSMFSFDGTNAQLTGRATNIGQSLLQFDFSLSFALNSDPQPGYCQFSGVDKGCTEGPYTGVDPSSWTYFDFLAGSFTGVDGSDMAGRSWTLADNPDHRAQAGLGANALEEEDVGFSMWFTFTRNHEADGLAKSANGYTFWDDGRGDINIDLSPVPLPAAGWLLFAALGGLVGLRRATKA